MFTSHDRHPKVLAIYDISSGSVGGAHVLSSSKEDEKLTFLASTREDVTVRQRLGASRLIKETDAALERAIATVRKVDVHHPSMVQVVLASPWYRSQTHTVIYKKETPFTCTRKLVDSLIDQEVHTLTTTPGLFDAYGDDSVIVEKQLSALKLNGYSTDAPYDKQATSLEFSLMLTVAPKSVIELFSNTLRRSYGTRTIRFTTNLFATFIVMRDVVPLVKDDCLIIDVGESITDSAFIKGGVLLYQHSFPLGTYNLYRTLVAQGVHTLSESYALLESYRIKKLASPAAKEVETAIISFAEKWKEGFQHMLEEGQHGTCIPETVALVADERFEQLLIDALTTDPLLQHQCISGQPQVSFVAGTLFDSLSKIADHAPRDVPLSIGAHFAHRLLY